MVRDRYKSLAKMEKAFKAMKSDDLMMRPIRHWNPKRVEGDIFMCMLAYLVTWEVRKRLGELLNPLIYSDLRHPQVKLPL